MNLTCEYERTPARATCGTEYVRTVFGIEPKVEPLVVGRDVEVDYESGRIVLFVGSSGSGKSSLLRAAACEAGGAMVLEDDASDERALIDTLGDDPRDAAALLSLCGLAEAFLMLRRPQELSDGQRYRYGLARCLAAGARTIVADEWCAKLDRTTARMVSRNMRKAATRRGVGLLAATTHQDIVEDLSPDTVVHCRGEGVVEVTRRRPFRRDEAFLAEFDVTGGALSDWPYFARWHYRRGGLGPVKWVYLLWHGRTPAGIALVGPSPLASAARERQFDLPRRRGRYRAAVINRNFASVTRLVLAPRFRGVGLAGRFLRRVAELTPRPWIELVSEMAALVPFCESAGFRRIGRAADNSDTDPADLRHKAAAGSLGHCGGRKRPETLLRYFHRRRFTRPVHYLFDNRAHGTRLNAGQGEGSLVGPRGSA